MSERWHDNASILVIPLKPVLGGVRGPNHLHLRGRIISSTVKLGQEAFTSLEQCHLNIVGLCMNKCVSLYKNSCIKVSQINYRDLLISYNKTSGSQWFQG